MSLPKLRHCPRKHRRQRISACRSSWCPATRLRVSGSRNAGSEPRAGDFRAHRLVNVLLLGSDEQLSDDSFIRTDTMIVVSLNVETGTVSMLSLPRDLFVYIPHGRWGD